MNENTHDTFINWQSILKEWKMPVINEKQLNKFYGAKCLKTGVCALQ